ncbi:MAG: DUF3833 domain-containing protein [Pseudomonadota bacterium]
MVLLVTSGCASMKIDDFDDASPTLKIEDYFVGKTWAWGIFEDRFGDLRRQFRVDIDGTWDGTKLVLDENFYYADGERDRRVWSIVRTAENRYEGTADDVVGKATGIAKGNALHWRYKLKLPIGENTYVVNFDDWMYLQNNDVLINRATVSKWGFSLGTVTLFFSKQTPDA